MPPIRALTVEDEPLAAQYLRKLLIGTGTVDVVGAAATGEAGLRLCAELAPDAAFLDVTLPGPDGLALASGLALLPRPPLVVFTTGSAAHASGAFRVAAVDYLLKPLDPAQVAEAVRRLEARLARPDDVAGPPPARGTALGLLNDRLPVRAGDGDTTVLLARREVVAALRRRRRTWVHTVRAEFATYYPLADLLAWLGGPPVLQVARDALVNMHAVAEVIHYGDRLYRVRLRDRQGTVVEASRSGAVRLSQYVNPGH